MKLEIRGEAFNIFNNVNFFLAERNADLGLVWCDSSTLAPPRILQVAAKFNF
jgi:hypothetical protein